MSKQATMSYSASQLVAIYNGAVETLQENGKSTIAIDLAKFCGGKINERCEEEKAERNNAQPS